MALFHSQTMFTTLNTPIIGTTNSTQFCKFILVEISSFSVFPQDISEGNIYVVRIHEPHPFGNIISNEN